MNADNPTTETFYDLFHMANEAVEEAMRVKHQAFLKADHNPTKDNIRAFLEACNALETAENNLLIVRQSKKHFKGVKKS